MDDNSSLIDLFEAASELARSEEKQLRRSEEKKFPPTSAILTLSQAAAELECSECSEEKLLRHIKQKKLRGTKRSFQGRRQWMVTHYDLNRYKMDKWVERHVDYRLTLAELCEDKNLPCATVYVFGPWEARLPTFTLEVSLADYHRFIKKSRTLEEHEAKKAELRRRLPGEPENFQVRFRLNPDYWYELQAFIGEVQPPKLPGLDLCDLRGDALLSLAKKLIPADIIENPKHYLKRATKNYYRDQVRHQRKKRLMAKRIGGSISHKRGRKLPLKTPPPYCPNCKIIIPPFSEECPYCHKNHTF